MAEHFNKRLEQLREPSTSFSSTLHELYHAVDTFAVVESSEDFNGDLKPLYVSENAQRYDKFKDKIHAVVLPPMPQDYRRAGEALFGREHYARDKASFKREGDWIIIADVDEVVRPSILQTMKYPDPEASPVNAIFADYSVSQGGSWDLVWFGLRYTRYSIDAYIGIRFMPVGIRYREWESNLARVAPTGEETQDYRDNKYLLEGIACENWTLAGQLMRDFHYKHSKFIDDADWHCSWCFSNISQFRTKLDSRRPEDPKLLDSADDISEYVCKNKERFSYMQRRWD
ncbi:MAG: glycosyl transferase [Podila humilis]|nr:MAG: glycosyl transferase [Podila humilis]